MNMRSHIIFNMGVILASACVASENKDVFKDTITGLSRKDFITKVMKYDALHERFQVDCMPMSTDKNALKDTLCAQLADQIYDVYIGLFPERKDTALLEEPFYERGPAVDDVWKNVQAGYAARYYWTKKTFGLK